MCLRCILVPSHIEERSDDRGDRGFGGEKAVMTMFEGRSGGGSQGREAVNMVQIVSRCWMCWPGKRPWAAIADTCVVGVGGVRHCRIGASAARLPTISAEISPP